MATLTSNNTLLIAGIIFITIAVIGQSKLLFLEINPGCFGRTLALFIGVVSLAFAFGLGNFPVENFELFRTYLARQIQENFNWINDLLQG
ncbi:hypothetical protein I8748_15195 [Nostoc sp. CENA67]|uniref:Uncharacterized protein n=1 Tax=Amazonocrinis nigriterrae CENA67 TaxID=2794033 RepID=A0A8J7HPH9_9NOST|nr:hypothetical protein [Amazonocrinis nigriterrae]MBH8563516.1 hypothetical protein [Amazonocrinis nigriterrae CENA67]